MTVLGMHNSIAYKKKLTLVRMSQVKTRESENERAGNQFKKALDLRHC